MATTAATHSNLHFWLFDYVHQCFKFGYSCKIISRPSFPRPAFVQNSDPPPEEPRPFQTPNVLPRNDLWPRPTAAPACGGNGWMPECRQFGCWSNCEFSEEQRCCYSCRSGDSGAERATGPRGQSSPRPCVVPAASQRFRLRLVPQPSVHTGHAAGRRRTNTHGRTVPRPRTATESCSGTRLTERSVCVMDFTGFQRTLN